MVKALQIEQLDVHLALAVMMALLFFMIDKWRKRRSEKRRGLEQAVVEGDHEQWWI